jgi:hypothetical protein
MSNPIRNSTRQALLLLGMHRSGTSLLAYLLHVLGAALPLDLIGPGRGNPRGHWEPGSLVAINDRVLQLLGRSWNDPRPIDPNWFGSCEARTFIDRIAASIDSEYGDAPLILIKDPRVCRLAPLYLQSLAALDIAPLVVFQLRPCADVIRSLADRDGLDANISEFLWIRSIVEAEQATRACPRAWVTFGQLCQDWRAAIRSVTQQLGLDAAGMTDEAAARIDRYIDPVMPHRQPQATDESRWLALNVWHAAQQAAAGNAAGAQATFDVTASALADFDRLQDRNLSRLAARYEARLDAVYSSTSWRLTKPLRALRQRMLNARSG